MAINSDRSNKKDGDDLTRRLTEIVLSDAYAMVVLQEVRTLSLPDWAIGAGFIRNMMWDAVGQTNKRTPISDIDVLYFDDDDWSVETEQRYFSILSQARLDIPWSIKNQARMHVRNSDDAYASTDGALQFWLETVTAVAVRLEIDDRLTIMAPYGLCDLFAMSVHPTPSGRRKPDQYRLRIKEKGWSNIWPGVRVEDL